MPAEALQLPVIKAVGWLGQACFFSRFFVQWLASERARRSVVPRSFWWLSLAGAALMTVYALRQQQFLLLFGYLLSSAIAMRNLLLTWSGGSRLAPRWIAVLALTTIAVSIVVELAAKPPAGAESGLWLALGAVGQAVWVSRFPVQWWLSERTGHSHFPLLFWWLSLVGNLLLLVYTLHLGDAVFVLGFVPGPLLQVRNLILIRRQARAA